MCCLLGHCSCSLPDSVRLAARRMTSSNCRLSSIQPLNAQCSRHTTSCRTIWIQSSYTSLDLGHPWNLCYTSISCAMSFAEHHLCHAISMATEPPQFLEAYGISRIRNSRTEGLIPKLGKETGARCTRSTIGCGSLVVECPERSRWPRPRGCAKR